jgi:hypothetical protein
MTYATAGGVSGLTSGRVTLSTGSTSVGDDAALLFSSASSVGTLTVGNSANGIVLGGAKLILKSASNSDIELTPQGTGIVNLTANQLNVPAGSQGAPAIRLAGSNNMGWYTVAGLSVFTVGGGNALILSSSTVEPGFDTVPHSNDSFKLGSSGNRWTDFYCRSFVHKVNTITGTTTLDSSYYVVLCNSASPFTVNLPAAASNTGRVYLIKNINTGTATIDPNSSETIDGASTYALSTQYSGAYIACDGTSWYILSKI